MNRLVVFVKAPVPGRVKTRLCPPLTPAGSAALYRRFVDETLTTARVVPDVEVTAAYEPAPEFPDLRWMDPPVPWFPQNGTDLGARLAAAFRESFAAGAARVVVIGSDTPDLPPEFLRRAFERLGGAPAVLGPSVDGGYYLIGLRADAPATWPALFEDIPWSTAGVAAATLAAAGRLRLTVATLPPWHDVDRPEDLARLPAYLRPDRPTPIVA